MQTSIYLVTVGNLTERKGHRADCAQVAVVFDVVARSKDHAVQLVKEAAEKADKLGKPITDPMLVEDRSDPFVGLLRMRVYLNGATISARTVKMGGS